MAFAKIKSPSIPLTLPTKDKEEIVLRHLTTADYKAIMSAVNTSDMSIFLETIKDVIEGAVIKPKDFSIEKYPSSIIDWLYLHVYRMSINGDLSVSLTCKNEVEKKKLQQIITEDGVKEEFVTVKEECGTSFLMPIIISDVVLTDPPKKDVIEVEGEDGEMIYIKLKLPSWKTWHKMSERLQLSVNDVSADEEGNDRPEQSIDKELKAVYSAIYDCLEAVFVGEEAMTDDHTFEEFAEWLDTFPPQKIMEFREFISDIPQLYYKKDVQCPSCGYKQEFRVLGLQDFLK